MKILIIISIILMFLLLGCSSAPKCKSIIKPINTSGRSIDTPNDSIVGLGFEWKIN